MTDKTTTSPTGDEPADSEEAAKLRDCVVEELLAEEVIVTPSVAAAMRRVPRERFAPGVALDDVYHVYNGLVTKRDADGTAVSSISAPHLQAHMLEQAHITEGMRVLEIGSGGYNAALLAELVGADGHVTTVDIDEFVTDRARRFLDETGYERVDVRTVDAETGVAESAPFDRILVTAGAWDIPPAWIDQLAVGGRLIVPLSLRGLSRTIAFEKLADGRLVSRSSKLFGFVPVRGAGEHASTLVVMRDGEVTVRIDDALPPEVTVDWAGIETALQTPRVEVWSRAMIGRFEPWATMQMWLATTLAGFCRVVIDRDRDTGLIRPPGKHTAALAVVEDSTLAYVTTRTSADNPDDAEFGVHAFGPNATALAEHVAEQLRLWERHYRGSDGPEFWVTPIESAEEYLPAGRTITKNHTHITISWPPVARAAAGQGVQHDPAK